MSHTYVSVLFHCVFSTKGRCGLIPHARQPDLWAYFGGIARKNGFKTLAAGGTDNHVHLLLSLPASMPLAKAMQLLKGGSSKWMNDSGANSFAWQVRIRRIFRRDIATERNDFLHSVSGRTSSYAWI